MLFKNYKKHGYKREDKGRLDTFRMECQQAVETAKLTYLNNLGNKVNDPSTSQKSHWKIINRVMNNCRAPMEFLVQLGCSTSQNNFPKHLSYFYIS